MFTATLRVTFETTIERSEIDAMRRMEVERTEKVTDEVTTIIVRAKTVEELNQKIVGTLAPALGVNDSNNDRLNAIMFGKE